MQAKRLATAVTLRRKSSSYRTGLSKLISGSEGNEILGGDALRYYNSCEILPCIVVVLTLLIQC